MKIKRYVAGNMQEAFERIREELGSDAVILNSRPIRKKGIFGIFSKPDVEVFVGLDNHDDAKEHQENNDNKVNDHDISELESKINTLSTTISTFYNKFQHFNRTTFDFSDDLNKIFEKLQLSDVYEETALSIANDIKSVVDKYGDDIQEVAQQIVLRYLGDSYKLEPVRNKMTTVMVVGPTGVGKTTTIAKLVALYISKGYKVSLITTDVYRVAAFEQLKIYASILGVPITCVYRLEELNQVIEQIKDKELVFIDMPGKGAGGKNYEQSLSGIIDTCKIDEIFLTLNVSTAYQSCKRIIDSYKFLKNYKIIITKIDECLNYGGIVNASCISGRPIAFITNGQHVPGDISFFDPDLIARKLLSD
ncbi:MAG: flagellar biosynthesis protein FlhF [Bacillota bacterium]|nr:flagellar biosynthesis protein FlhF [Bacillota bacterium]